MRSVDERGRQAADNLRAAGLMVAAMSCFGVNDALVKLLSQSMLVGQIMALRGCFVIVLLMFTLRLVKLPVGRPDGLTILRGCLEVAITFCFLEALSRIPLAAATTIFFSAPVAVTLMAALVLKEHVGARRWAAVILGFIGVVVAMGPAGVGDAAAALALLAAVLSALRDIITRRVPPTTGSGTMALVTAALVTMGGFTTLPAGWSVPEPGQIALLLATAALVGAGYMLFVVAVRVGELSFVAPFRYVAIPLSMILGMLMWGHVPTLGVLTGASIIIGSGLFIFFRERALRHSGRL